MWNTLAEPFHFEFLRHALIACTVAGALCGIVGVFIVLRGMSYLGHGLSHAIFGGAALCAAIGFNFFIGAALWGLGSGLAVSRVTRRRSIGADAAIGVITTASFAFGIALLGLYSRVKQSIDATVFGSVLGVSTTDVWVLIIVAVLAISIIIVFYRPLLFTTFDAEVANVFGVRTGWFDALLMVMLSFAILASMKVLGVTLIAAAIVIPPVTARMLTHSFKRMLVLSGTIGALAGLVGMYLSYHLDISSGATIVLVNFAAFAIVYLLTALAQSVRTLTRSVEPTPSASTIFVRETAPELARHRSRTPQHRTHAGDASSTHPGLSATPTSTTTARPGLITDTRE